MGKSTTTSKDQKDILKRYGEKLKNASQGVSSKPWEPLRTHWVVTGALCRKSEREAYAAIPSQYNGSLHS